MSKACFSQDTSSKHAEFFKEYKTQYEQDLDPESKSAKDTFPKTLEQLIQKLKKWKRKLSEDVERRVPNCIRLEDELPKLRDVQFREVEVPGSHKAEVAALAASAASGSASKDHTKSRHRLAWIDSEVDIVRRHGNSYRAITLYRSGWDRAQICGANLLDAPGEKRRPHFTIARSSECNHGTTPTIEETKLAILHAGVHSGMAASSISRRRQEPRDVWGSVRSQLCALRTRSRHPYGTLQSGLESSRSRSSHRLRSCSRFALESVHGYRESTCHGENIFSQYMYKTLPNGAHLWTFKRQLCQQLALSSFVSALLRIGGRTPRKISFAKNTGKVFMLDFYPSFDSNGLIEYAEPVPFRLTKICTPFSRHSASKATSWPLWQPLRKHAPPLAETFACTWTCTSATR